MVPIVVACFIPVNIVILQDMYRISCVFSRWFGFFPLSMSLTSKDLHSCIFHKVIVIVLLGSKYFSSTLLQFLCRHILNAGCCHVQRPLCVSALDNQTKHDSEPVHAGPTSSEIAISFFFFKASKSAQITPDAEDLLDSKPRD